MLKQPTKEEKEQEERIQMNEIAGSDRLSVTEVSKFRRSAHYIIKIRAMNP
jgi:hypothetical protein